MKELDGQLWLELRRPTDYKNADSKEKAQELKKNNPCVLHFGNIIVYILPVSYDFVGDWDKGERTKFKAAQSSSCGCGWQPLGRPTVQTIDKIREEKFET